MYTDDDINNENNVDNNENNTEKNAPEKTSLRGKWAAFGKGMGKSMTGLGKAIVKTAKAGVDRLDSDTPEENLQGVAGRGVAPCY